MEDSVHAEALAAGVKFFHGNGEIAVGLLLSIVAEDANRPICLRAFQLFQPEPKHCLQDLAGETDSQRKPIESAAKMEQVWEPCLSFLTPDFASVDLNAGQS